MSGSNEWLAFFDLKILKQVRKNVNEEIMKELNEEILIMKEAVRREQRN